MTENNTAQKNKKNKIEITAKQVVQFNEMRNALIKISKQYQTTTQLRKNVGLYGLDYEEELEMAYENIQNEAEIVVKGIKALVPIV